MAGNTGFTLSQVNHSNAHQGVQTMEATLPQEMGRLEEALHEMLTGMKGAAATKFQNANLPALIEAKLYLSRGTRAMRETLESAGVSLNRSDSENQDIFGTQANLAPTVMDVKVLT